MRPAGSHEQGRTGYTRCPPAISSFMFRFSQPAPPCPRYGLSWAGQTYDGTTDGTPRGKRVGATIPSSDGKFYFGVHPATIAVLEVGK